MSVSSEDIGVERRQIVFLPFVTLTRRLTARIFVTPRRSATKRRSDMHDQILDKRATAARAGVSVRTLERLDEEGEGPPRVRLGKRRIGYWESDLMAWLRSRTSSAKRAA